MFELLPKDVALYITSILVKHAGTDDMYSLALSSELLKACVIHVMGYKMPKRCVGKYGPVEWASLLRGNLLEVDIPSEINTLEKKHEFYALDLSTVEKATVNSIHSFPHVLPRMPNLRSLTLTCDVLAPTHSNNYIKHLLLSNLSLLSLTEVVLDCERLHSETGSKCIQSVIFSSTIGSETQQWENGTVKNLTLSYGQDCRFWDSTNREIRSVFPHIEFLTCLRAPLEVPGIERVIDHLEQISICSSRGSFSSGSRPFFEKLLKKLVKLEYTHLPVSREALCVLKGCKTLEYLELMIAEGAEDFLFNVATCLRTLSISWGSCRSASDSIARAFYSPEEGLLPSLVESASNLSKLRWLHAKLPSDDLLKALKLIGRRLRSLEVSLEHQSVCHGQYFLMIVKGLSVYNPYIRFLKLGFCCDGRHELCQCGIDASVLDRDLSTSVRVLSKHAPLLETRTVHMVKNRIIRNHVTNSIAAEHFPIVEDQTIIASLGILRYKPTLLGHYVLTLFRRITKIGYLSSMRYERLIGSNISSRFNTENVHRLTQLFESTQSVQKAFHRNE